MLFYVVGAPKFSSSSLVAGIIIAVIPVQKLQVTNVRDEALMAPNPAHTHTTTDLPTILAFRSCIITYKKGTQTSEPKVSRVLASNIC